MQPEPPFALVFTEQYKRWAARFLERHPDLRQQYLKTLQVLQANPAHPSLRLQPLRITLELLIQDGKIIPVNFGDHDAVY